MSSPSRPSSWRKIDRAREHLDSLRQEIRTFGEDKPYGATPKFNDDFTELDVVVEFDNPNVLAQWGLLFGDCVHNFRSALDHIVYEIAIAESGQDPPPDERVLMFPVCRDETEFNERGRRIRSLSSNARTKIELHQPYHRPQPLDPKLYLAAQRL